MNRSWLTYICGTRGIHLTVSAELMLLEMVMVLHRKVMTIRNQLYFPMVSTAGDFDTMKIHNAFVWGIYVTLVSMCFGATATANEHWPSWRGPDATGIVTEGAPPTTWSETENVKWKAALPGEGQSTPIIWGDKIFLQQAVPVGKDEGKVKSAFGFGAPPSKSVTVPYRFVVICLDRNTGETLWETEVREAKPHEGHHPTGSLAPYSPVTDGEHVWVSFGSRGVFCLDMDGKLVWEAEARERKMAGRFGEGSSPVLTNDAVIVLADQEGPSQIVAYDKATGDVLWSQERDEESSWSSPVIANVNGRQEVITSASQYIRSYDAKTGELIWKCAGLTGCAAPSPVLGDGVVYCSTGFRGVSTMAIELGHEGDLTDTDAVLWKSKRIGSNVPTPLLIDNRLYVFRGYAADLSCYDTETGELIFTRERLEGSKEVYASPIAANGYIYIPTREGYTTVLRDSANFEVVANNKLDEALDGSPAVIGDELYLRGRGHLYCIAAD